MESVAEVSAAGVREPPFFQVGLAKLALMSTFTLGFYDFFWSYKQWDSVRRRTGEVTAGSVDILAAIDDDSPLWVDAIRLAGTSEASVSLVIPINGTTISLTFTASRFLAFVEQLRRFADSMPGKPS